MIPFLLKYIMGFLQVKITTKQLERFMNLCNSRDIEIWNISSFDEYALFNIYISDYYRLKDINKKTHSRTKIIKKTGLPFKMYRYRKHKFFVLGIATSFAIIYYLSLFVWEIDVEGNYSYSKYEIVQFLENNKICYGMKKAQVDCDSIEKIIRNQYDDVTWASVEMSGTRIVVHIKENFEVLAEKENTEKLVAGKNSGYDIVAKKNATIFNIVTRSGEALVKKGEKVKKGEVLIEGRYDVIGDYDEYIRTNYVVADGDVWGELKYRFDEEITRAYTRKKYTGKYKSLYVFVTDSTILQTPSGKISYKKYDVETENKDIKFLDDFILPVNVVKMTYREYNEIIVNYTDEQLENILNERIAIFLKKLSEKGIQILENNVKIEVTNEKASARGEIRVIEKIGKLKSVTYNEQTEGAGMSDE